MIVEEREHVLRDRIRNEVDLFRRYVARFWDRRPVATDLFSSNDERNDCMQEIAYRMEDENRMVWTIARLSEYISREKAHLGSLEEWQKYLIAIRVYSFLDASLKNQDEFAFSHEAFREYFLAEYLVKHLAEQPPPLGELRISQEVARLMADVLALEHGTVPDLKPYGQNANSKYSELPRNLALIEIVARHRCPQWNLEGADFSGLDLTRVDFSGCKLNQAQFLNSDLEGCRFDNAELKNAKFVYSNLDGASFRGVKLDNRQLEGAEGRPVRQ
jgi:hypothetical protein